MIEKIVQNWAIIVSVLLGISESLALIPSCKSNGILDGMIKFLKALKENQ